MTTLPPPVQKLWDELQAVRADVLREVEGLSQAQADWKPGPGEWSIGEVVHHLTVAEIATGKLTTKLTKEAAAAGTLVDGFPADFGEITPLPDARGARDAPEVVWPEHGKPIGELVSAMKATRVRSEQSIEKVAATDPRRLVFKHGHLGTLDLGQWWKLQAAHDGIHLAQIRDVKRAPGFPER
jgi:hypothetical protein